MKTKTMKITGIFLTLVMLVTMLGVFSLTASAADDIVAWNDVDNDGVQDSSEVAYTNLSVALTAGGIVKLTGDYTLGNNDTREQYISMSSGIATLDLNGYKLSCASLIEFDIIIMSGTANLTITDSKTTGIFNCESRNDVRLSGSAKLTIAGGIIQTVEAYSQYYITIYKSDQAVFEITGGRHYSNPAEYLAANHKITHQDYAPRYIVSEIEANEIVAWNDADNDGVIDSNEQIFSDMDSAINANVDLKMNSDVFRDSKYSPPGASIISSTVTIDLNGYSIIASANCFKLEGGILTIKDSAGGGQVYCQNDDSYSAIAVYSGDGIGLVVESGTIIGDIANYGASRYPDAVVLKGGNYTFDPSRYIYDTTLIAGKDQDGLWGIRPKATNACSVTVSGEYYYTGEAITPTVVVTELDGSDTLVENVDYTVNAENNVSIGVAKVTVTFVNGYRGSITTNFTIDCDHSYSAHTTGTDNGNGTHSFKCFLCSDTSNEAHDHTNGKCICGKKATPTYTVPTGLTATYGQTLADISLPAGFTWQDVETANVGNAGIRRFNVTYTPNDTENYEVITDIEVTITVDKLTPRVSVTSLIDKVMPGYAIELNHTSDAAEVNEFEIIDGEGYSVNDNVITIDDGVVVGTTLTVKYRSVATENYESVEGEITLTVGVPTVDTSALENAIDALEGRIEEIEAEFGTDGEVTKLRAELDALKAVVAALDESYVTDAELAAAIGNVNNTITSLTTRVKNLEDTYATKTEVNTLRQDLNDQYGKLLELIDANTLEIGAINTILGQINTTLTTLATKTDVATEVATLTGLINALTERVANTETGVSTNAGEISSLKTTVEDLATELRGADEVLTNSVNGLSSALTTLTGRVDAAEQEIDKLQQDLADAIKDLDAAMKKGDADLSAEIASLNKAFTDAKDALEKADADNKAELIKKIEEADKALDDAIKALQKNLDDAKTELDKAIKDGDTALDTKITNLNTALTNAVAALEQADTDNKAELVKKIEEADASLQAAIDKVASDLAKAQKDLADAIATGDAALSSSIASVSASLSAAKTVLEKADADNKAELEAKIEAAEATLDTAIKAVQMNLDDAKAELEKKIAEGDAALEKKVAALSASLDAKEKELAEKDKALETFIIVVCVITGVTFLGSGAFVTWFFIDKKKKLEKK